MNTKKENECVRCGCYNLSEFKKVERKHIHCLDCYRQVRNEKQRENRKQKREEKKKEQEVFVCKGCGEDDEEEHDGFENCDCGYIHHCEDKCPNETTREHYERWVRDDDEEGSTTNEDNDEYMEEDMGECPKCDCAVKRKDLAWRVGYYLDICAKCDELN
jgi:hypothetical protein